MVDGFFYIFAVPAAFILRAYRRRGSANFPLTTPALKRIGLFPVIAHYYQPLFDDSTLTKPLSDDRDLPGIERGNLAVAADNLHGGFARNAGERFRTQSNDGSGSRLRLL